MAMKMPSFEQVFLGMLVIGVSAALYNGVYNRSPGQPERYIDYCGDSVYKRPGAVQQDGITPLLLPDQDVAKYRDQVHWIRPATDDELQILLHRYERRSLPLGYQLWTVTADAPNIGRVLARQYQCVVEPMLDTSQ